MNYRLSRCVHLLKNEELGKNIAYNNLNFKLIELDAEYYEFLNKMKKTNEIKTINENIEYLISNKFLIKDTENELIERDQLIKKYREKVKKNNDRKIKFMRISLTENCNLRCKYCFVNNIVDEKSTLSKNEFIKYIKYLISENENPRVQYFGGESLIKMDLIKLGHELLESAKVAGEIKSYSEDIVTNGTLLDNEKMNYFIKNNMKLIFSIDGWKEINDKNRIDSWGNGTFDIVINKILKFREMGGKASVIITPNEDNLEVLDKVVEFLFYKFEFNNISINSPQPEKSGWQLDGKMLALKIQKIFEFCEENKIELSAPGINLIYNMYNNKYQIYSCTNYSLNTNQEWGLYILSYGKISYCQVECNKECTINSKKLEIDQSIIDWHLSNNRLDKCKKCLAYSVCNGPCSIEKVLMNDNIDVNKCAFNIEMIKWGLLK